jgi:hypothetical protein
MFALTTARSHSRQLGMQWMSTRGFSQRSECFRQLAKVAFDTVLEQFDSKAPHIADGMLDGVYHIEARGTLWE